MLFVAMALLSLVFLGRRDWATWPDLVFLVPGLLFLAAAAIGLPALQRDGLLERATLPMSAGLLSLVIVLYWLPDRFVDRL